MVPAGMSCKTCGKIRRGNLHHPDGTVEPDVTVCLDRRCEPGLNTYWRSRGVSA